ATETKHKTYLNGIVNALKGNPGVFMWDVKNEPDNPGNFGGGSWNQSSYATTKAACVSWLSRMCAAVRADTTVQPVSTGLTYYSNIPDVISFCDIAAFHSYYSDIASNQIPWVKARTTKPINVEEFGWPSGPNPYTDSNGT